MLLSGKNIASECLNDIKRALDQRTDSLHPGLGVILVGSNPASEIYVNLKRKSLSTIGIETTLFHFPDSIEEKVLHEKIEELNQNGDIDGILIQLPLPKHIDTYKALSKVHTEKDVDGLHPLNMGKLLLGHPSFIPCTPLAIHAILQKYQIPIKGKHVVILGRSALVGKPLAALLLQKKEGCNATVTVAHTQTKYLSKISIQADILIAAMGQPKFITQEMVKKDAVVVDVGIHKVGTQIVGDVDFDAVSKKCHSITPVPGGIGPMTVAMLAKNVYQSFQNRF